MRPDAARWSATYDWASASVPSGLGRRTSSATVSTNSSSRRSISLHRRSMAWRGGWGSVMDSPVGELTRISRTYRTSRTSGVLGSTEYDGLSLQYFLTLTLALTANPLS